MIDDDNWWVIDDDAYDEDCWMVLAESSLKMFQNLRPSLSSDCKCSKWWMTMNEDKDGDDLVRHTYYCTSKYVHA